ncbi:hypothetical protein N7462_007372 [Penicillium macrosclerotiorum]|uniref:uncharacterized protein n=1 Tax=Penicillium macrosclerotiorum TaxID=303699 RepID=UPI002547A08B|nr:uncharacterized protein N7462_007372 [Penicillium macrosclerotiorum]KAJ5679128.1 hypothetical protein N7462_007372 [Penicillium macrosclerotiorum]
MAAKQDSEATVAVNVEELRNSKDAVIMRLMALQSYIADLSKAYIEHANNVINGGPATIDIPAIPVGLTGHFDVGVVRAASPGAKSEAGGQKKRKRAPVDPNAPKRALTPYFLYMQHNRSKIAEDLGGNAKPKEVADEGTRRWQSMTDADKEKWKQMYLQNYETYKQQMAAYKAGRKTGDDDAAHQLQQDFAGAENAQESDSSEESSESDEDSAKRRRSDIKPAAESPVKAASPKKRGAKNAEPASVKATPAEPKSRKQRSARARPEYERLTWELNEIDDA